MAHPVLFKVCPNIEIGLTRKYLLFGYFLGHRPSLTNLAQGKIWHISTNSFDAKFELSTVRDDTYN